MVARWKRGLATGLALGLTGLVLAPWALGMHHHAVHPVPRPDSAEALEDRWDTILRGAVHEGQVDYGMLAGRREALSDLVSTLAEFGPDTAPDAFQTEAQRYAYYVNAYNTLVVYAVVEGGLRRSVHEVRGPISPVPGFGFFWAARFRLDGRWISLYGLEHDILRPRFDARLHAAINCASVSCPALAPVAYRAETLSAQLDAASARFAAPPHVRVDDAQRTVTLSAIYDWYAEDFDDDALSWIADHAADPGSVDAARRANYAVRFADYDWRLNGAW